MDGAEVRSITREIYEPWVLKRHYAKRLPIIQYAYGLFRGLDCVGVVGYGPPATNFVARSVVTEPYRDIVIELNRLIVADDQPRNSTSYLVAQSLRMLPQPSIVVSYADEGQGHHGYIYQATNFTYHGKTAPHRNDYVSPQGVKVHPRTMSGWKGVSNLERWVEDNGWTKEKPSFKHRYLFIAGGKTDKRRIRREILWAEEPYPKGDNRRYDATADIDVQGMLF